MEREGTERERERERERENVRAKVKKGGERVMNEVPELAIVFGSGFSHC